MRGVIIRNAFVVGDDIKSVDVLGYMTDVPHARVELDDLHNFNKFSGNDNAKHFEGGDPPFGEGYIRTIDTHDAQGVTYPGSIYYLYDSSDGWVLEGVTSRGQAISVSLQGGAAFEVGQAYHQDGQHYLHTRPVQEIFLINSSLSAGLTRMYGQPLYSETTDIGLQYAERIAGTALASK